MDQFSVETSVQAREPPNSSRRTSRRRQILVQPSRQPTRHEKVGLSRRLGFKKFRVKFFLKI